MKDIILDINLYKDRPIPEHASLCGYRDIPINNQNNLYSEKLIDISSYNIGGLNYYHSCQNPPYYQSIPGSIPYLYLRKTVVEKLANVNEKLLNYDLEIFVFDAYRPVSVQSYMYNEWVPRYLKSIYPDSSDEWIHLEVDNYWARPQKGKDLFISPPPHATGAAVDLTIRYKNYPMNLEMGGIFDDITDVSHLNFYEKIANDRQVSFTKLEAMRNRRLLHHIMIDEGFVAHPKEWWHFSYGDQMWALQTGEPFAKYGYIDFSLNGT